MYRGDLLNALSTEGASLSLMNETTIIFETFLMPTTYKTYQYITEYLEHLLHIPTILLNGEGLDDFAEGHADVGVISAQNYFQLQNRYPSSVELVATPLPLGKHEQEVIPTFFALIVRKDSSLRSLNDLEQASWAAPMRGVSIEDQEQDEHGCLLPTHFSNRVETTSQAQALRYVLDGKVDVCFIEERLLELVLHNSPCIAGQVRVIGTYSDATSPLLVLAAHLEPVLKRRIQEALLSIHQNGFFAQRLREGQIERFLSISSAYFEPEYHRSVHSGNASLMLATGQKSL
jgi:phosphonate transport system substrate-binding protein